MSARTVVPAAFAALLLALAPGVRAQAVPADQLDALRYRYIGPQGNRVSSVAGVAGDPSTYYVGAASGGIWKSEDAGISWRPLFDDQQVEAIGALAVAASDPQIVWAGTGEPHLRSNVSVGDGVYKSTDGGGHWTHMGLDATGRISRVVIHPRNPDIVYVAALGHAHGPQQERGIYRTLDGGKTWKQVLFVDPNTGASDLTMDPNNPRVLFAGMWTAEMHHWGRMSGGPGSGIYESRDGGDTWTKLAGHGLPKPPIGKTTLCMTPVDSRVVYAMIETGDGVPVNGQATDSGELWRSGDGGATWELRNYSRDLSGRTAYYNQCRVSTDDADEVYFLSAAYSRTLDGGRTYQVETGPRRPGGDHHDMWIDPMDGDRQIVVHDQGVSISTNRGETWHRVALPIGQMYHVTVDAAVPYHVMGNRQDGPSARGPSNSLYGGDTGRDPALRLARRGRRGERLRHARPDGPERGLVERLGLGRARRDRRALGRAQRAVPQRRGVAGEHGRRAGVRGEVPLPVDLPAPGVAARPQHALRDEPGRAPYAQRRAELGGDQPRPDHERHDEDGGQRRAHAGQHRRRVLLRDLRVRRVAGEAGRLLRRLERREGARQSRRRRALDGRDRELPRVAEERRRARHRRLEVGRGEGLPGGRGAPRGRLQAVRVQDHRLRRPLDEDHHRAPRPRPELHARHRGRPGEAAASSTSAPRTTSTSRSTTARAGRRS